MPIAFAMFLFLAAEDFAQRGFVLRFAALLTRFVFDDALGLRLADTFPGVGLDSFNCGELFGLLFNHSCTFSAYRCAQGFPVMPSMKYFPIWWGDFAMEERDFFNEQHEQRTHTLTCPHCGKADEYQLAWLVRRKRDSLPRHADERDRARFAKAQSYMVRKDDMVACKNIRCRKRFEVAGVQSVAFLQSA
jgi:hypothetical protein